MPENKRKKLNLRSIEMTFFGYEPGSKGYWLWNSNTWAVVLSRDMTFNECSFSYWEGSSPSAPFAQPAVLNRPVTIEFPSEGSAPLALATPPPVTPPPATLPCVSDVDTTVFQTSPLQPTSHLPLLRACAVCVRRRPDLVLSRLQGTVAQSEQLTGFSSTSLTPESTKSI